MCKRVIGRLGNLVFSAVHTTTLAGEPLYTRDERLWGRVHVRAADVVRKPSHLNIVCGATGNALVARACAPTPAQYPPHETGR